jgi:hypothetical protein
VAHEQPAAEALFHGMQTVAHSGLGYLGEKGLRIPQQDALHVSVMRNFVLEEPRGNSQCLSRDLNNRPVGSRFASKEQLDSHYPVISNQTRLGGCAILHRMHEGNHGAGRKVDILEAASRFVKHLTKGKSRGLQFQNERRTILATQSPQKMVLRRTPWTQKL